MDAGRVLAWGLIGRDAGAFMVAITRAVRRYLDLSDFRRIEAHIEHGFAAAHRWARLLGFTDETPAGMREFRPGETYHLYARVNHG
jgi:RimJ/RimL family protein N-acetyltransferase